MPEDNNLQNFNENIRENESQSLKRDLFRYLKYWKWILLSAIISLVVSYVYLRYTNNVYNSSAKIKILKKKDSGMDLSGLTGNTPMFDMSKINLQNETEILLSRRISERVVDNLNLTTFYYTSGRIKTQEIFGTEVPFTVTWLNPNSEAASERKKETFIFTSIDKEQFRIQIVENSYNKKFSYGNEISIDGLRLVIHKNRIYKANDNQNEQIYFQYKSRRGVAGSILSSVNVEQVGDGSEVLKLSLAGQNIEKNEAILNNLVKEFNLDGITDDQQIALKTREFVENRLSMIETELDSVESNLVDFKSTNSFIDVGSGASQAFSTYSTAEQKSSELQNQLQISRYILEEVKGSSQYSLLPGNVGLESGNVMSLISQYNTLVLERNKIMASATESSPQVIELSQQLRLLNSNIEESINSYIRSIQISLENMNTRERRFNSNIKAMPQKEKFVRSIQRQKAVKENLYIFLLQKQVEADLSAAITAPTAKVVDYAFTGGSPVSPRPKIIYLAGLVIGLAFPISILYLIYLFDTKVTSKEQVQAKLNIPIVAEIPLNKNYDGKVIGPSDNSDVAEAFRILRTNMNYLNVIKDKSLKSKVFFSTSSTKGEGKTFTAINSASIFASNNQKTLLIGCDLRNPQLHSYLGVPKKTVGLSSFLSNPEMNLNDVVFKNENIKLDFDIILSGEIPPNPSELLNNGRLKDLLDEAREIYDYVIVDTAPTMLVTDTLTIIDQADAIIYMIRTNFTELKLLRHINDLVKFNKQNNLAIAINAVEEKKGYEYNYGYGYGYYADKSKSKKKWYQF